MADNTKRSFSQLSEEHRDALLEFMVKKPATGPGYHRYLLHELNTLFGFQMMMIFPYPHRIVDQSDKNKSKYNLFNNYITLNMDHHSITTYFEKIQHVDIFAGKRLPSHLRGKRALLRKDIVSDQEYYDSEYQRYMASIAVDKEACIYVFDDKGKKLIATIGIFRGQGEPEFSPEEKKLFEYLSEIISNQYMLVLESSQEVMVRNTFDVFYKSNRLGAMLLDQRLAVVRANHRAFEICRNFVGDFKNERPQFFRSSIRYDMRYQELQELADWIGNEIINSTSGKHYSSLRYEYHFFCSPYVLTNVNGELETNHLVQISVQQVTVNEDVEKILLELTGRESEILNYVLMGHTNERIAELAYVSKHTIRTHISNIYRKFQVGNRVELLMRIKGATRMED